jgi:hypothetical protein
MVLIIEESYFYNTTIKTFKIVLKLEVIFNRENFSTIGILILF